jgi:Sugar phosphate isomerases/epimerases
MKNKVYAQLYSIVRQSKEGHIDALKAFSEMGYDGVELLGSTTDGLSQSDFKKLLKDLNLDVISSHSLKNEKDYEFAADLGARYCVIGINCNDSSRDKLLASCEEWNAQGKKIAESGLKAVLHNHAEEFWWVDDKEGGTRIYDLFLENTDPKYVNFQIDVGWVGRAGVKPEEYITKYAGRFSLVHVKECNKAATTHEELRHFPTKVLQLGPPKVVNGIPYFSEEQIRLLDESRMWNVELGKGLLDFPAIVKAADAQGCMAYNNEREYYRLDAVPDGDPVKCAKLDYEYLRSL